MPPHLLGALVAAAFGLVYVLANAGGLPDGVALAVRLLAAAAAAVVLAGALRGRGQPVAPGETGGFSRGYWLVCLAELVAIVVGSRVLAGPLDLPEGGVAWVTTVVGVHFVALGVLWQRPVFHLLAGLLTALGLAGLLLAVAGASQPDVAVVAGVGAGAVLLAAALWAVCRPAVVPSRP